MIIDTDFHGFPKRFLDLTPGRLDTRGLPLPAFEEAAYLEVMETHGVDVGVTWTRRMPWPNCSAPSMSSAPTAWC